MKKYITPAVETHEVNPLNMIAESFKLSDTESGEQLTKEDNTNWEIWEEE